MIALLPTGISVITPETDDREVVHAVIYDELCVGVVREASRRAYTDVIDRLVEAGAQGRDSRLYRDRAA